MFARLVRPYHATSLGSRMALASCLGMAVGLALGPRTVWLEPLGALVVQGLALLAPPLVLVLVLGAVVAADTAALGRSALRAVSGFAVVAAAAAGAGIAVGLVLGPAASPLAERASAQPGPGWSALWPLWSPGAASWAERAVPLAFVLAMFAAIALRVWHWARPDAAVRSARSFLARLASVTLGGVSRLLECAPVGVFILAAVAVGRTGAGLAATSAQGFVVVYLAQVLVCLLLLFVPFAAVQQSPRALLVGCQDALWTAVATGSSAATLPVELRAVERGLGVDPRLTRVLVPLGVAVSKTGTTVFLAALTVVASRANGVDLTPAWLLRVALLAVAGGVVTPPVAGGGILMLGILFATLSLPAELASVLGAAPFIGRLNTPLNALGRIVVTRLAAQRVVTAERAGAVGTGNPPAC